MAADLSALGLVPPEEHPDAELLALLALQKARSDAWNATRGDRAKTRLLAKWKSKGSLIRNEPLIARIRPITLEGFCEKADGALWEWRNDDAVMRYERFWAPLAATLEQAMQIIQAQQAIEMPAGGGQGG